MNKLRWWFVHLAVFVVGQGVLLAAGESWPAAFLAGEVPDALTLLDSPAMWVSRMWCVVFAVDTAWSWLYVTFRKGEKRHPGPSRNVRTGTSGCTMVEEPRNS